VRTPTAGRKLDLVGAIAYLRWVRVGILVAISYRPTWAHLEPTPSNTKYALIGGWPLVAHWPAAARTLLQPGTKFKMVRDGIGSCIGELTFG
jgi:hypothetical protein